MHRSRVVVGFLLAPMFLALVVTTLGCGGSSEEPLVRRFFAASRMGDNVTLANIATVVFDPKRDGQVESMSFVSETEEQVQPLELKARAEAFRAAQAEEQAFTNKKREYQDANAEAIKRVLDAEATNKKLNPKDAAIQAEWTKWRTETQQMAKKVSEARARMNENRDVVEVSMQDPQHPIDVTLYEGVLATKEMTVSARVRTPGGEAVQKTLTLTLQQARLKGDAGDLVGNWVITKIREGSAQ
ncbi:MAG: hypothetical protein ACE148_13330 [Vicinamibacterales bacterium]